MLLETLHQRRKRGVVVVVLRRLVAHLRLEVRAVSLQHEAADYDRGMMQNMLLLASIGLFAVAIYCSRPPTPTAVPDPDPEDLGLSILPRALLAGDDDTHWSERPKPDHAKMRSLLAETRAVAAAAEEEKHERLAGASAAEAQHVTVRRTPATAEGELLVDGGVAAEGDAVGLPCVRLLQAATAALLEETQAEVDKQHEVTIRGAGEWAVHVESTRRILDDWKELHATYDIQYAAATDGGWQLNEQGNPLASAAVFREDGSVDGGALDPDRYPSSYECARCGRWSRR